MSSLARQLAQIHRRPLPGDFPKTLSQLRIGSPLRHTLAARFKAQVGQAPVEYAAHWRMRVAASRLQQGSESVSAVAASLGYLSDAAFGVAFRRVHGTSPGRYRRTGALQE
ncbi:helix-turn-helix domain-containing protein [Pseudomonas sp. S2_B12]